MFMIHSQSEKLTSFLVHICLDPTPVTNYKLASVGFAKIAKVFGSLRIYIYIFLFFFCFQGILNLYMSNKITPIHYTSIWNSKV